MAESIGIDLGTTNSVGAVALNGGTPQVVPTRERKRITPSVVARHHREGTLLVGEVAIRAAQADPVNAIFSIKRLMGRRYTDPEVEKVKKHVSYRIVQPDGGRDQAYVQIGDKSYSPIEVSALILEKIKEDAQTALSVPVTHAVITVPAYFDDNQREATRQAGNLAGFKVKRIIDEPTAAAYAFGMNLDPSSSKTIIVYDLGGGTFDISIISISEGVPVVEHVEGDNWLGGDRFDAMIMDYVLSQEERKNPGIGKDLRADPEFMWKLKQAAEDAKKTIGGAPSADIVLYGMLRGKLDVDVQLKQADFESWVRQDIEGSVALMEKAMRGPGLTPADIDNVLLVGGSTALPLVRRLLAQRFGAEKIKAYVDPMECVALGAAVLASRTEKKVCPAKKCQTENEPDAVKCARCGGAIGDAEAMVKCPHCQALHAKGDVVCERTGKPLVAAAGGVTAKPYGIEIEGGKLEIIVPKSTRYPTPEPIFREFKTVVDAQERIVIPVYQGFDEVASKNELQAEIVLPEQGPIEESQRVPKGTPLDIGFAIDENGTLEVRVKGKGALSWLSLAKVLRPWDVGPHVGPTTGDTVAPTVDCPRCHHKNRRGASVCENCGEVMSGAGGGGGSGAGGGVRQPEWKQQLSFWTSFAQVAINEFTWTIQPAKLERLKSVAAKAQRAIDTNDEANGLLVKAELDATLQDSCGFMFDLIEATLVYRARVGSLDKNQQLGNLLEEYKQRVRRGEDQDGPAVRGLRERIGQLVQEICGGIGKENEVECPKCHKMRPPATQFRPKCPNCGFDPTKVGL
jgi:molecular chaperone DnaK